MRVNKEHINIWNQPDKPNSINTPTGGHKIVHIITEKGIVPSGAA